MYGTWGIRTAEDGISFFLTFLFTNCTCILKKRKQNFKVVGVRFYTQNARKTERDVKKH
jgi:hypothetical protein